MSQRPPQLPAVIGVPARGLPLEREVRAELGVHPLHDLFGDGVVEAGVLARGGVEERERRIVRVGVEMRILPAARILPSREAALTVGAADGASLGASLAADDGAALGALDGAPRGWRPRCRRRASARRSTRAPTAAGSLSSPPPVQDKPRPSSAGRPPRSRPRAVRAVAHVAVARTIAPSAGPDNARAHGPDRRPLGQVPRTIIAGMLRPSCRHPSSGASIPRSLGSPSPTSTRSATSGRSGSGSTTGS